MKSRLFRNALFAVFASGLALVAIVPITALADSTGPPPHADVVTVAAGATHTSEQVKVR